MHCIFTDIYKFFFWGSLNKVSYSSNLYILLLIYRFIFLQPVYPISWVLYIQVISSNLYVLLLIYRFIFLQPVYPISWVLYIQVHIPPTYISYILGSLYTGSYSSNLYILYLGFFVYRFIFLQPVYPTSLYTGS